MKRNADQREDRMLDTCIIDACVLVRHMDMGRCAGWPTATHALVHQTSDDRSTSRSDVEKGPVRRPQSGRPRRDSD